MNSQLIYFIIFVTIILASMQITVSNSKIHLYRARADIYVRKHLYNQKYFNILPNIKKSFNVDFGKTCFIYNGFVRIGTGVFLSEEWVVTASYLVNRINVSDILILTGQRNCKDKPNVFAVGKNIAHRHFNSYDHDIALLKVMPVVRFNSSVQTLKLPSVESKIGKAATVSSWIKHKEGNGHTISLKEATVSIYDTDICQKYYVYPILTPRNLCALQEKSKKWNFAIGDPVTQGNKLIGYFQGNHHPGVTVAPDIYVNIVALRLWIETTMFVN